MSNYKSCHSAVSDVIYFAEHSPECRTCPQLESCKIATRNRQAGYVRPSYQTGGLGRVHSIPVNQPQQPHPVSPHHDVSTTLLGGLLSTGGPLQTQLRFDPRPEEEESLMVRTLINMGQAGVGSFFQELSNALFLNKIHLKPKQQQEPKRLVPNEKPKEETKEEE